MLKKKIIFLIYLRKNCVRNNFNAVFCLEKTALDRILRYIGELRYRKSAFINCFVAFVITMTHFQRVSLWVLQNIWLTDFNFQLINRKWIRKFEKYISWTLVSSRAHMCANSLTTIYLYASVNEIQFLQQGDS